MEFDVEGLKCPDKEDRTKAIGGWYFSKATDAALQRTEWGQQAGGLIRRLPQKLEPVVFGLEL